MAAGGWLVGGTESSPLHAYLETCGVAATPTGLSNHANGTRKARHADTPLEVRSSKTMRAADFVCALAGSLSASCASVVTRTRSYFEHRTRLRAAGSNIVTVEDQQLHQRRSSSNCQRRQQQQQHQQKRRDARVGAAEVPKCFDYGAGQRWCRTACVPALCAGVVAVLCYVNSLDGDFVHDDMVAVVGNPDVTGESSRHASSSSSSSLWINDFWGATDGGSSKS
ncbi:hypothetical protein MTO96_036203 [Rhipicephalus appendiculatus]